MIDPGKLDRKIRFERGQAADGGLGAEPVGSWAELATVWAMVRFGTGQERRQAAAEGASQPATFRVVSTTATRSVTEQDRIAFDGRAWDIAAIAAIGVNEEIEFTATVAKG